MLDPVVLEEAGDLAGKRVLDVGCGEGRFCRMAAARGAMAFGLDPTRPLIERAHRANVGRYAVADGVSLPLASSSFDVVIAYLVLIDIPDYRRAIHEMARVLRPGGKLVIANLNSFATTGNNPWHKDEAGRILHLKVEDYFEEKAERVRWADIEIINFHRPMEDYMTALLSQGLVLRSFREPRPTEQAVELAPRLRPTRRVPIFHVMTWERMK